MVMSVIVALLAVLTAWEKPPSARASAPCGGVQGVYLCNVASPGLFDICIGDQKYTMSCPGGLHFNARTQVCDWPQNADCGKTPPAASLPPSSPTYQRVKKGPDSPASDLSSRADSFIPPAPVDDVRNSNDDIYLHEDEDDDDVTGQNFEDRYEDSDFAATDRLVTVRDREVKDLPENQGSDQHNIVVDKPSASYDSSRSKQSGFRTPGGYTGRRIITPRRLESHERGGSSSVSSNSQPTPSSGGRTNPYLARGLKYREMMLRQKEQNDKSRQARVSDDGYNRFYNSNRKAALKSQSGTTSAQYPQQKPEFGDEKKDNDNSIMTYDTQKQASFTSKTNKDNMKYLNKNQGSENSDVHINRNDQNGEESNDSSYQNSIQATDDSARSASNVRSSDRFGLASYPWWTSKSSSFTDRSSSSSSSPARTVDPQPNLSQRQSSARMSRERGISSKQTSRSSNRRRTQAQLQQQKQELGLRPFYQPLAAASSSAAASSGPSASASASAAAAASNNVPPQQALSARSITAAAAAAPKRTKKPTKTGKCSPETCKLPDCFCVGADIPGGLKVKDTPMMVMLTFDDSVNVANYDYFTKIFGGELRNPNGCPIKGTFYVSGDSTQYHFVEKLYKMGQEIASHSVTHRSPTTYWATAGYDGYVEEIEGMRKTLAEKSKIPRDQIKGMRVPFLQVGGDDQYQMLEDYGFTYDTSMVTGHLYRNDDPPVWPFTLDYAPSSKHCSLTPCPTKSYPGLWEVPLVRWYGSNRLACAMPDGCTIEPGQQGTLKFLEDNFRRHYDTNKSPLGIFLHASWFRRKDGNLEGLLEFLQRLSKMDDVWVVSVSQVIDWIRSPSPLSSLSSLPSWACR